MERDVYDDIEKILTKLQVLVSVMVVVVVVVVGTTMTDSTTINTESLTNKTMNHHDAHPSNDLLLVLLLVLTSSSLFPFLYLPLWQTAAMVAITHVLPLAFLAVPVAGFIPSSLPITKTATTAVTAPHALTTPFTR